MYCAWCGAPVAAVSYEPCPRCGNPTNGAQRLAPQASGSSSSVVIIVVVVVLGLVVVGGIFAAIAIPNMLTAAQRAKQKRTMADLRTISTALESYATEKNAYPKVQSFDDLGPLLVPTYIKLIPARDGWGGPFRYACSKEEDGRCVGYILASGGKDRTFEHADLGAYVSSPPGPTTNFDCDIVYADGKFVEYPEGVQH
jgi:type II secretory pathway pseudopilin PulG